MKGCRHSWYFSFFSFGCITVCHQDGTYSEPPTFVHEECLRCGERRSWIADERARRRALISVLQGIELALAMEEKP